MYAIEHKTDNSKTILKKFFYMLDAKEALDKMAEEQNAERIDDTSWHLVIENIHSVLRVKKVS